MTQKELKEKYKQMKFPMGVFQIRNTVNGKIFVDSSTNLPAIWNRHKTQLDFGGHPNSELQKDWKEVGEENFVFEILSEIEQDESKNLDYKKEVKALELLYIDDLQPFGEKGYNWKPKA